MPTHNVVCGLLLVCANGVAAACEHPPLIAIPEKEGIGDRVADVLLDMRRYADGMASYVACVQAEVLAAGDDAPALQKALLARRNNTAVQEAKALAELFVERIGPIENLRIAQFIDSNRESCVSTARLDATAVVDDRVVLFYQRNGGVLLNILEIACPSLERDHFFTYQPRSHVVDGLGQVGIRDRVPLTNRLCHTDHIYTYDRAAERPVGSPCALGWFFPITEAQAATLLEPAGGPARIVIVPDGPDEDAAAATQ